MDQRRWGGGVAGGNFFFLNKLSPLSYRILSDEKNFAAHNFLQVDNLKHPLPKDKFYTNLIIYIVSIVQRFPLNYDLKLLIVSEFF